MTGAATPPAAAHPPGFFIDWFRRGARLAQAQGRTSGLLTAPAVNGVPPGRRPRTALHRPPRTDTDFFELCIQWPYTKETI